MNNQIEVTSNGKTVWVNGLDGCLARFCRLSVEMFAPCFPPQTFTGPNNRTTRNEWDAFVTYCQAMYDTDVTPHRPDYIET